MQQRQRTKIRDVEDDVIVGWRETGDSSLFIDTHHDLKDCTKALPPKLAGIPPPPIRKPTSSSSSVMSSRYIQ